MKNKNYWPLAIVGIILFGIVIICVGVVIAVKNPIVDELSFGDKKRVIDERINEFLHSQRDFEAHTKVILHTDSKDLALTSPYEYKPRAFEKSNFNNASAFSFALELQTNPANEVAINEITATIESFLQNIPPLTPKLCQTKPNIFEPCEMLSMPKAGRYKMRFGVKYADSKEAHFEEDVFIGELPHDYKQKKGIYPH
ncbi:hypothetical protein CQA49_00570 [Helicobacter sp. MIT 00-7814]|uniref:hypothetical protein n=1 Tax=unclassified Helicobacter TaxID=2593540 RepID=UPI000E1F0A61|nr:MULTISPECIES: hypothetical protein [unclassified Helicobacter]RDU57191.1 hypothetical protein CQA49_00570 [Helicobacter sp. MIT 00-7814]RDU57743.1 hypothetical protein CQA37_00570 [Helicobacter sp. MIT 99-10781]